MSTFAEQLPDPVELEVEETELEVEETRVARWRFDQFRALGFEPEEAFLLTISGADLQAARRLVERKCSLELTLQILL